MRADACSVVYASEAHASQIRGLLPRPYVFVTSREELMAEAATGGVVAFVSFDLLEHLAGAELELPIIGIIDAEEGVVLPRTIRALDAFPWVSHVVSTALLATPRAHAHILMLLERLASGPEHSMLGPGVGRSALLSNTNRREARLERMREFFERKGVPARTLAMLEEVADELVLNALYDAPAEAGYFARPKERIENVELPPDRACEISYGIEDGMAFVRVRDTFGALTRKRLFEVLSRCDGSDIVLDESRGGAGLGLWRVLSVAATVTITVVPGGLTEILVGVPLKSARPGARRLLAMHLFFADLLDQAWPALFPEDGGMLDQSITMVQTGALAFE